MRVLVTGAGGFLGAAIVRRLAARGDIETVAAMRRPSSAPGARQLDLADKAAIVETLDSARPQIVIHAAGRPRGSAGDFQADNVGATTKLARAIGESSPATRLLLLSSAAQYGRSAHRIPWRESDPCAPLDAYGTSKLAAERAALEQAARFGLQVTVLRLFNVISGDAVGDTAFSSFIEKAISTLRNGACKVEMAPLGAVRDFVAVEDFLRVVELVIDRDGWGETLNVCTGVGRSVRQLIEPAVAAVGRGLTLDEPDAAPSPLDWSVGDPSLCRARLGFAPSGDLTAVTAQAASVIRAAAEVRDHA
jgi:nucleoside-diphosphate-sugar epimerase